MNRPRQRRSRRISLLLSGALAAGMLTSMTGCAQDDQDQDPNQQPIANNTFVQGRGYYHAGFHAWYPYPFNFFDPMRGYYYGGGWYKSASTHIVTKSFFSSPRSSSHGFSESSHGTSRGGFGATGHSSGHGGFGG
jgi:uncharacterized membrane protein YgcG